MDMPPRHLVSNVVHLRSRDAEFFGDFLRRHAGVVKGEYLSCLRFVYFCVVHCFSNGMTTFLHHVGGIFLRGPKEQVAWIYARRIVAMMAYEEFSGITKADFIRNSMGASIAISIS